jgi:hypothetical protein
VKAISAVPAHTAHSDGPPGEVASAAAWTVSTRTAGAGDLGCVAEKKRLVAPTDAETFAARVAWWCEGG